VRLKAILDDQAVRLPIRTDASGKITGGGLISRGHLYKIRVLIIPWTPPSAYRRREIIEGGGEQPSEMPPMKTKARAILIDALRDAHRWLDELTTDSNRTIEALAAREGKTQRSIRMTLLLAFLSPALAHAAIDTRLPQGFGVKRLMDLPMAWSRARHCGGQWRRSTLRRSRELLGNRQGRSSQLGRIGSETQSRDCRGQPRGAVP
jgi:hypothetical protein